jgi:hypothetical protein
MFADAFETPLSRRSVPSHVLEGTARRSQRGNRKEQGRQIRHGLAQFFIDRSYPRRGSAQRASAPPQNSKLTHFWPLTPHNCSLW